MDAVKLKGFAPVAALLALENDLDRFDYLADLALDTPALTRERCTEEARVASCDSKLWILLEKQKKRVALQSQSDSLFVKGLADLIALVVREIPLETLCGERLGLARLLYEAEIIDANRLRGMEETEERIRKFADEGQNPQSF
mgnify:FL=1